MARIGGVNIPNHAHAEIALTAIFGIGRSRARSICAAAGVNSAAKIKDLSDGEMDKLRELYDSLTEARRELGQEAVPFQRFTEIVRQQVQKMSATDPSEVAFRVAVKDGKVNLTAKKLRGGQNPIDE